MYAYISRGFIVKGGWSTIDGIDSYPRLLETKKELIVQKCHVKQACHLSNTVSLHKKTSTGAFKGIEIHYRSVTLHLPRQDVPCEFPNRIKNHSFLRRYP